MDILYNKRKFLRCIRYLHRHLDAWKDFHVICERCLLSETGRKLESNKKISDSLLTVEEVSERYDAWVEYYYRMDDDFQNRFSEYWLPIGENFLSDLIFVDLLFSNLPIIVFEEKSCVCVCPSLIQFVEEYRYRNRFYHKWFRTNTAF